MSLFKTAYDTTAGSGFMTAKIALAVKESFIKDNLKNSLGNLKPCAPYTPIFVTGQGMSEANIPYFSHPLIVEDLQQNKFLCIDVRSFVRVGNGNIENNFNIKNQTEYNLAKSRLALNLIWIAQRPEYLKDLSHVPNAVFASWISESLSRRFALDPKDQLLLAIVSSFYYQTLFTEFNTFNENEVLKMASSVIKATRAPAKLVFETIDKIESISNISEFCNVCKQVLENPRLDDLNAGLLITIIGSSWFGMSAKEILAVSLEHPPTWISVIYSALTERTFKNSMIAKIADRFAGSKGGEDFIKSYVSLVGTISVKE